MLWPLLQHGSYTLRQEEAQPMSFGATIPVVPLVLQSQERH
jgi:hypothetical protein